MQVDANTWTNVSLVIRYDEVVSHLLGLRLRRTLHHVMQKEIFLQVTSESSLSSTPITSGVLSAGGNKSCSVFQTLTVEDSAPRWFHVRIEG